MTMPMTITPRSGSNSIQKKPSRYSPKRVATSRFSKARITRNWLIQTIAFGNGNRNVFDMMGYRTDFRQRVG